MAADGRDIIGEIDVAFSSAEEFGRIAMAWLTDGVRLVAGDISDEILAGPPLKPYWHEGGGTVNEWDPAFHARQPPLWGEISVLYPPRNRHYWKPYSKTSLKRLEALAPVMEKATAALRKEANDDVRKYEWNVIREGEDSGFARLMVSVNPNTDGDYAADCPEVAFMRGFAEQHDPVFGHISYVASPSDGKTQLEQALILRPRNTLAEWDHYLRGYSWVTVIPAVLAAEIGGMRGLRDSGAFAFVDEVSGGSLWLQATRRWSEFAGDQVVVDRVFEGLAPVLPPGEPLSGLPVGISVPGVPTEVVPFLLAIRDAGEFCGRG